MYPIMELSREPVEPGPDNSALSGLSSSKRNPPEGVPQTSRKMLRSNDDIWQQDSVGSTPGRSVTPEILCQGQDHLQAEEIPTRRSPSYPSYRTAQDHQSNPPLPLAGIATGPTPEVSPRQASHQPTATQEPDFVSPSQHMPTYSSVLQAPNTCAQHPLSCQWNQAYPGFGQPLRDCFPPYVQHLYYPTDRIQPMPPTPMSLKCMTRYIALIDDVKVRDVLAIAVVRHRDIHDMVHTEYERTAQEMQDQLNEDASVLSFSKEHTKVQNILYGEYDELVHWRKQETVHRAFGSINEIIMAIPCHVRPRSNWKTKFNAFLTLIWIGRGIVDGIGSLPNEIRNQMAIDSKLVDAMERVYATMSEEEILGDALRLIEALADLEKDRGRCFAGLDKLVDMFKEVMRQGRTGEERI
ncbi:hypothetical protein D6D26_02926 [Aureobasidium pullulans]|nr:hypothetical protein D6D26_02926 [Aureobasidium pullulans]